jgi:hypothetical protein
MNEEMSLFVFRKISIRKKMKMKVCLYMFLPKDYFLKKKIVVKDLHKHSEEMIIILNDVLFLDKQRLEVHEEIFEVYRVKFNLQS